MTIPDYKEKHEELRKRMDKSSPPLWLIVSLIALVILGKIFLGGLEVATILYVIFIVFLVMLGLAKIVETISDKNLDRLIRDSDALIHKGLASERRFRGTNLIEYCPSSILEKFLVLKSGKDASGEDHIAENVESTSTVKSKQSMEDIKYWAPEIAERLLNEKEEMAEKVPDIVKIAKIKDAIYEPPGIPQSEDAKLIMEFYTDQTVAGEETGEIADEHPSQESYLDSPKNELTIEENQRESEAVSSPEKPSLVTDKRKMALKETLHANISKRPEELVITPDKREDKDKKEREVDSRSDLREKEPPSSVPEEKKEYKVYSHEHRNGTELTNKEYDELINDLEPIKLKCFLFLNAITGEFYLDGVDQVVSDQPKNFLKLLIRNVGCTIDFDTVYEGVVGKKLDDISFEHFPDTIQTAHKWNSLLKKSVDKSLKKCLKSDRGKGYKICLGNEKKYFLLDYLINCI
jgi:hypothetical protein